MRFQQITLSALACLTCLTSVAHADIWDDWDDEETEVAPLIESFEDLRGRSQDAFDEMYDELEDEFNPVESHLRERRAKRVKRADSPKSVRSTERVEQVKEVRSVKRVKTVKRVKRVKKVQRVERRADHRRARAGHREPPRQPESKRRRARPSKPSVSEFEARVLELVNRERARGGDCGGRSFGPSHPLRAQKQLADAALRHARSMSEEHFFDHRGPRGDTPKSRIDDTGYRGRAWGENIAAGQRSPETVVRAWMDSPGHCRNILNPLFSELGVSFIFTPHSPYKTYWVQAFGTPL